MHEQRFSILSTSSLPFERIPKIPDSVEVRVIPFIEIIPRGEEEIKSRINAYSDEKRNVIFTSTHAVQAVTDCLEHIPDWTIYCVGKETRSAIEKYFGVATIAKMSSNAKDLSQLILNDHVQQVIFFCGDQRMNILPENLIKKGVDLTELIVYDTRLTPVRIEDLPDAILFFSPTAVNSFFSLNTLSSATTVFAMGSSTAEALSRNTNLPVIISPEADKVFVLNLALEFAGSHHIT